MVRSLCGLAVLFIIIECGSCYGRMSQVDHMLKATEMLQLVTGQRLRDYVGYGNYCGIGGSGPVLDPIDMCCKIHDDCYGTIIDTFGPVCEPFKDTYEYSIVSNSLSCVTETFLCSKEVCKCDESFMACLQVYNIYYDRSMVRTGRVVKSMLWSSFRFLEGK